MLTQIINGHILTPQGWMKDGSILISDGKILEVTNSDLAVIGAKVVDAKGMSIVPGFVAMNIHGGGGFDFSECTEEAFHGAVAAHLKHGATTIFPTVLAPEGGNRMRGNDEEKRGSYLGIAYRGTVFESEDGGEFIY